MIEKYITTLKKSILFKTLSEANLLELFREIPYRITEYSKGDIIFSQDDTCETLNVILNGKVEIQKIDANGKVLSIAEFGFGDIFGEMLLFTDNNLFPITVLSKTNTIVLHMHKDSVLKLCQLNSDFLLQYLRIISNKAMLLNMKLNQVTLKTIRQKICEFILLQYKKQNNLKIKLTMTKKDWADKLGVQRPSLSRELIKMKEENIIDYDKDTILIKDLGIIENYI